MGRQHLLFSRVGLVTGIGSGIYRITRQVRRYIHQDPGIYLAGSGLIVSLLRLRQPGSP
jgi:hypothetical protein